MQTRSIGSLRASIVGLGCNNFGRRIDAAASAAVVHAALDAGITFFDTADICNDWVTFDARSTAFTRHFVEQLTSAGGDDEIRAAPCKLQRGGTAYATAGSGDYRNLSLQLHITLLPCSGPPWSRRPA